MDEVLREALEPVLRDLASAGLAAPTFEERDWIGDPDHASSMMWSADGTGAGVSVARTAPLPDRIVEAADRVQEWTIESELWGRAPTNWPPCPRHRTTHPLQAAAIEGSPVWVCPADRAVISPIGSL